MILTDTNQRIQEQIEAMPGSLPREPATVKKFGEFEASFSAIPANHRRFWLTCGGGHFGSEAVDDILRLPKSHIKFRREFGPPRGWTMTGVFIIG